MSHSVEDQMITSKEVLEKTGISRATLNNYIKMGILPKPVVMKPTSDLGGIKQIGYFPKAVIDVIERVQQYKRQGLVMEEIVKRLTDPSIASEFYSQLYEKTGTDASRSATPAIQTYREVRESPSLNLSDLDVPALFVDKRFEIQWMNPQAEKQIFNLTSGSVGTADFGNIFELFFSKPFCSNIQNWQQVISHHLSYVKPAFSKDNIRTICPGLSPSEIECLDKLYDDATPHSGKNFACIPMKFMGVKETVTYQVHRMAFRDGVLFAYAPVDTPPSHQPEMSSVHPAAIHGLVDPGKPTLVSYCVLVADMQDISIFKAEYLPNDYFNLINESLKILDNTVERHHGVYGKQTVNGMAFFFIENPDSPYMMNALYCALDIKGQIDSLNSDVRLQKPGSADVYVNMGISEGRDFLGVIRSSSHMELISLGDSVQCANRLSEFARHGAIWTTQRLISRLEPEDRASVLYGVNRTYRRRRQFIENTFCRMGDLLVDENQMGDAFMDVASLSVTEILAKKAGLP